MLKNDRFIRALLRKPVDRTPVWIMRQAGRYLPEYRATRKQAGSFLDLCKNPDLACEVTFQPLRRFNLDAAILFSDILTVPNAMGLDLQFITGEGPKFSNPIQNRADIDKLATPDPEVELSYVMNAVRTISKALDKTMPLIGFAGSPWTIATYMIEGGSSKTFNKIKTMAYQEPILLHQLLKKATIATTDYLKAQIAAGVDVVMIFDTWGGILSHRLYREFSLKYISQIIDDLPKKYAGKRIPKISFTKGGGLWLDTMVDCGADALGLDWTVSLSDARNVVGNRIALQGNMDPCTLYGTDEMIVNEAKQILSEFGTVNAGFGHVFNLGHGIHPDINPDKVKLLIDSVHELSSPYHTQCSTSN